MIYKKIPNEADTSIQYTDPREYQDTSISGAYANVLADLSMSMDDTELEQYLSKVLQKEVKIGGKNAKKK